MDLHIGKPIFRTQLTPGLDTSHCPHTVLRVRQLFTGENWIIDTTGCQYGFRDVLIPYEKYLEEKACRIIAEPAAYDAVETKDLDYFSTLEFMNKTQAQKKAREVERRGRLHFAAFIDTRVNNTILDGSAGHFRNTADRFADELRSHMLEFAVKNFSM